MTNSPEPTGHHIPCPGCDRTLNVPPAAAGHSVSCPHCGATFHLPARLGRKVLSVPKQLFGPALALILFGMAGLLVNGYLSLMFAFQPGSDHEFARTRVKQVRTAGVLAEAKKNANIPEDEREELPAAEAPLSPEEEALAVAWTPNMRPLHLFGTFASSLTLSAGVCLLAGRYYWLAVIGCIAAWLNVDPICCIPGGLAGVWGLLMLVRDDARGHFRRERTPSNEP